jgi:SAM-dependent methyltransferase
MTSTLASINYVRTITPFKKISIKKMKHFEELLKENHSSWFKRWFDSSFYHQLYGNRNEKEGADFIDGLIGVLQPGINSTMLDLGCGAGRHSKYLASKGFKVTGIDLAFSSIRSAAKFETDNLQFYRHDMRVPFGNSHFDYVFNFFTSFGYFADDNENRNVINNISNALKPDGIVMMDYLNVPYCEERIVSKEEKEIDDVVYDISRWSDDKHFFKKIAIHDPDVKEPVEYTEQVAKFYLHDFEYMFGRHGLQVQKVFGDYRLNEYDVKTSPRLILIGKKK